MKKTHVKTSKFLSFVLRHKPESVGLSLDEGGWVEVDRLIEAANASGRRLTRELLEEVVRTNDKQRFTFSQDGLKIRANQGHSREVELGLPPAAPPDVLYHGTAERFIASILEAGLVPRGRRHVHLSPDEQTARLVGQRHGVPVVLSVDAGAMHADGFQFFLSENGVWLTERVPAGYLYLR